MDELTGLIAAPFTPLSAEGELNVQAVGPLARMLADGPLTGAFIGGTTGESLSLSVPERKALAEAWVAARPAGFSLLVHVGTPSLPDACELADHARRIGADAVSAMGPSFFAPPDVDALVDWCGEVASAAAGVPFYYYHIPSMTGVHVQLSSFLARAVGRVPTLAGAKFTCEDLMDFVRCAEAGGGRWNLLFGRDEFLLAGLALGARGAVGTTYTFAAPLYRRIIDAFEAGDLAGARSAQKTASEMMAVYLAHGGLPAGKAIMGMIGVDVGPPRLPLGPMAPTAVDALRSELDELGFFDWCLHA